jgi:AcrR family transcriptional regulator
MPGTPGRPSRETSDEVRSRILAAARSLFAEHGYAATPVSAICKEADVAKPAVYWHFENKEGLFIAVLEEANAEWIEDLRKQVQDAGEPQQRLQSLMAAWRSFVKDRPASMRLPMVAQLEQAALPQARTAIQRAWQRGEEAITDGLRAALPGLELPQLEHVAFVAVTLLQGAMMRYSIDGDDAGLDRRLEETRRAISLLIWARVPAAVRRLTVDTVDAVPTSDDES